jgi:hypothetical protein
MKANIECLKVSFDNVNEMITSLMTQSQLKTHQQKQQLSQFNKIKDQYKAKLQSYRESYESTHFGKVYGNKTIILSQIHEQIQSKESELKQLQVFSLFNLIIHFILI